MARISKLARIALYGSTALIGGLTAMPALADDAQPTAAAAGAQATADDGPLLGEIVVTAQKRSQNLQDVPIAVSAFSGEQLDKLGISVSLPPGETQKVVINAPPGTYEFYCNVPGHKEAGMVGTLTVK